MGSKQKIAQSATIDGKKVKIRKGWTVLDAAQQAGIYIPTLCHLEALEPYGGCRLCLVEVNGMKGYPTSCTTPVVPGMEVLTKTPGLQKLRREILEFTLSEHPYTCLVCRDKKACTEFMHSTRKVGTITGCNFCTSNGDCELQDLVDYLDLTDMKFPITYRGIPPVKDNPFYDLDYNLCILCGRCVRICNEERNSNVLAFVERGHTTIVGTAFQESQLEAGCEYCGACVDVCPTGSISEKMGKWRGVPDRSVRTTCTICPVACDMNVNSAGGKLVQIGPEPGKRTSPAQLCLRGKFLPSQLNDHPSRISMPLLKKEKKWVELSWKEAFSILAEKLGDYSGSRFGLIASGQETLEDNYTLQKFARKVMRSNNVDLNIPYPSRKLPEQIYRFHRMYPPAGMREIEKADTLLLIGMDASVTHPLLENRIRKAFMGGKNVIIASSFPTRTSMFSTVEISYLPGEEHSFLDKTLRSLEKEDAGTLPDDPGNLVIIAGDSLLRHPLAEKITGSLFRIHELINNRKGCHLLFPGHSSGFFGSMIPGMHPDYLPGFEPLRDRSSRQKFEAQWETKLNGTPGWSCNEQISHIGPDGIGALMVIGDLPAHPGLAGLDLLVQCNMFKTPLSEYADLLLPVSDLLENDGHILSMELKLKKVNRVVSAPDHVRNITGIISGLAAEMKQTGFDRNPAKVFREMKTLVSFSGDKEKGPAPLRLRSGPGRISPDASFPVRLLVQPGPLHYRGNRLNELVPEIETIHPDGVVHLPDSMIEEMGIESGDSVRIVTALGEMNAVCRTIPGMTGHTAWIITDGEDSLDIVNGVYPEESTMFARIEKA